MIDSKAGDLVAWVIKEKQREMTAILYLTLKVRNIIHEYEITPAHLLLDSFKVIKLRE